MTIEEAKDIFKAKPNVKEIYSFPEAVIFNKNAADLYSNLNSHLPYEVFNKDLLKEEVAKKVTTVKSKKQKKLNNKK